MGSPGPRVCTATAVMTSMTTNTAPSAPRPKRLLTASGKLLDTSNSAAPTLSAHRQAIQAKRAEVAAAAAEQSQPLTSSRPSEVAYPTSTPSTPPATEVLGSEVDLDLEHQQPHK
ncbi:hypothetical protein L208DRAFT_11685 [Tricholoma matsutake]|nr:hypothetical protein L208DRAFT_11685 [Tricholoma matsutake 945]